MVTIYDFSTEAATFKSFLFISMFKIIVYIGNDLFPISDIT